MRRPLSPLLRWSTGAGLALLAGILLFEAFAVHGLSGPVKLVAAVASAATAIALLALVPKIFQLIDTAHRNEARRAELEQLNDELERFNYTVAHDLRAPLRGIAGFNQALREDFGPQLPPKAREYLEKMHRSVGQMDHLILELLKYATIGRQALEPAALPLDEAVRGAQALLEAEIREREAVIEIVSPLPVVRGDATLLQVTFLNLLGNAIRFVARGTQPQVAISARTDGQRVRVFVDDNGLGIPADAREKIFQMFERFHPGYSGTGIGLAIVQRAVQRLDGQVGLEPAPGGRGTRFWIELPLA